MPKRDPSPRLLELDVFRGLAALGVLTFHYTTLYAILFPHQGAPLFYFPWIPFRVQLFAMISGFVIVLVLEKTKSPLDFIMARFSRLFPCYLFAVILITMVLKTFAFLDHPALFFKQVVRWQDIVINLTMLQAWFGFANIDNVFWFLAPELTFYFILFIFFVFKKLKYTEPIGLAMLILVVLNAWYGHWGPFRIPTAIIVSRILSLWPYFLAGILFYNLKTKEDVWWRHAGLAACFITQNLISDDIHSVICLGADFIVFYLFVYGKLTWIVRKPLVFLGTISYSLYLIHMRTGLIMIHALYLLGANAWLRLIIPAVVSIGIATFMTFCIERPCTAYLREKYNQWLQTGQSLTPLATQLILYWSLWMYADLCYTRDFFTLPGKLAWLALIGWACRPNSLGTSIVLFLLMTVTCAFRLVFRHLPYIPAEILVNGIILIALWWAFLKSDGNILTQPASSPKILPWPALRYLLIAALISIPVFLHAPKIMPVVKGPVIAVQ